jgi:hypothetical protein
VREGVPGPGPLEEVVQAYLLQETGHQALEEIS